MFGRALPASVLLILMGMGAAGQAIRPGGDERGAEGQAAGRAISGAGVASEPWAPYPAEDPLVWGADACLGFFMTGEVEALGGGVITLREEHRIEVELGEMRARIRIQDVPPDDHGVLRCETLRWPELPPTEARLLALGRWIEDRLRRRDGWSGGFDPSNPGGRRNWAVARYRNDALGVTLRLEARRDRRTQSDVLGVTLEADYFGPPIVLR